MFEVSVTVSQPLPTWKHGGYVFPWTFSTVAHERVWNIPLNSPHIYQSLGKALRVSVSSVFSFVTAYCSDRNSLCNKGWLEDFQTRFQLGEKTQAHSRSGQVSMGLGEYFWTRTQTWKFEAEGTGDRPMWSFCMLMFWETHMMRSYRLTSILLSQGGLKLPCVVLLTVEKKELLLTTEIDRVRRGTDC